MPKIKDTNKQIADAQKAKADAKAQTAKAPAASKEPKIPEGGQKLQNEQTKGYPGGFLILDAEGYALNRKGDRDTRWKAPFLEAQQRAKSKKGSGTGATKEERMRHIFGAPGERGWTLDTSRGTNGECFSADAVHSVTGARLNTYYVIVDEQGNEATVGKGEMVKYAGVQPPQKARAARANNEEFNAAFDEATDGEAASPDDVLAELDQVMSEDEEEEALA